MSAFSRDPRSPAPLGPLAVAIAVAAGIALAPGLDRLGVAAWPRWLVGLAVVGMWWRHRQVLILAGLAFGLARGARPAIEAPAGATIDDRRVDQVSGVIRGPIAHGARGDGARLAPDGDGGEATIWLWADAPLVPGERVVATGLVHAPRGLRDPGVPDHAAAVRARGAALEMTAQTLARHGDAGGLVDAAWRWADATQRRWARAIDAASGDGGAALRGIVAGDRGEVPAALDQRWRAVGIFHVLSVSGLHLAVVAGLAFGVLRRLAAASPWGGRIRPARWAAPPALGLAIAYTMITGAQLATLRSLAVIGLVLAAAFLDRPLRLVDALGAAAIAILAWRPADLLDPSFQLSFVAALTLALRPATGDAPFGRWRRLAHGLGRGIAASAWVTLTTAPQTAFHFHQVAVGGVIGNLVLTPLVELIALPLGLAGVVVGCDPAIALAAWIVGLADRGAAGLAEVTPLGHVAIAGATAMVALTAGALWLASRERWARGRWLAWVALCLVWGLAGRAPPPAGALRVTFLDVGQGDAALVELPDGAVWLIDAGGAPNARELAQAAAPGRAIDRVLAASDHTRIDLAIVSHPHPDHYLGLAAITAPIGEVWTADGPAAPVRDRSVGRTLPPTLPDFAAITGALAARGTRIVHPALGVARREAGVELAVWAPRFQATADAPAVCAADPVRTVNDNSLVVALAFAGRTIVFTGDVEAEGEDGLLAAGLGAVDVVKVAHHGSPTSSTPRFVAHTRPRLAVISCGLGNPFGFPAPAVVARWQAAGATVARTDRDGAVTVTIGPTGALAVDRFASPEAGEVP